MYGQGGIFYKENGLKNREYKFCRQNRLKNTEFKLYIHKIPNFTDNQRRMNWRRRAEVTIQ